MCVGVILATIMSIGQDKIASRFKLLPPTAEGRLYFSCIESAFMPIGLFWFGWTSYPSIPYIVPALAVGCATMGIFSIYLAVFNYLADTYHRYASSAIAAQSCCKYQSVPFTISHRLPVLSVSPYLPCLARIQAGTFLVESFHWSPDNFSPTWGIPRRRVCWAEL